MFVRIKTTPDGPRRAAQLVESVRDGRNARQRIVRHIGVAFEDDELERLRRVGECIKAKMEDGSEPQPGAPEWIAEKATRIGREGDGRETLEVDPGSWWRNSA